MKHFLITVFICIVTHTFALSVIPADSIGMETINGNIYILHSVENNETLYSVSRRYNIPISKIIESNPPTEYGLETGQVIRIPYERKVKKVVTAQLPVIHSPQPPSSGTITHTVAPKETLFSISRQYGVAVDDIKKWNHLSGNALDIGQTLVINKMAVEIPDNNQLLSKDKYAKIHVVKSSETLFAISRMYHVSVDQLKTWNSLVANEISIGQELVVGMSADGKQAEFIAPTNEKKTPEMAMIEMKPTPVVTLPISGKVNFEEVVQTGMAEKIEGTDNSRKYLALHRTAKIGTIMRVRNEMNDQEVFVRVLGKLPDTGINENVIIKISKAAYDRLGAIDPKFRVSVSYIP